MTTTTRGSKGATGCAPTTVTLVLSLVCALTAAAARAETASTEPASAPPSLSDRFLIEIGGFHARTSTQAGLSGSGGGAGVVIDFENVLGLDDQNTTGIGGFVWRITDRWRLDVEYFRVNRSGTRTLATDIKWGDQTFTFGTSVDAEYNFYDTRISAGYSFYNRPDKELGVGIGLHVAGIEATIQSTGGSIAEAGDVLAPLPVLNFYGSFGLTDDWALRFRADWLSLTYGDYSGDVRSMAIDFLYQPFRHVGFALGMRSLVVDLEVDSPDWRGGARTNFTGPTAVMTVSF